MEKQENELIGILKNTRAHLMNGVSYMILVVVGGGILCAISMMINGGSASVPDSGFAAQLWTIGASGLTLMVAVFSAFIAMSIADRPGFAPGLLGGYLSSQVGAGFLGGIVTGLVAGIVCYYLKKLPLPKSVQSLKSIIIIPILGLLVTGGLMVCVLGGPLAAVNTGLTTWLTHMSDGSKVVLGIIVGCMIAFDLGGPVNKVAYSMMAVAIGAGAYDYAAAAAIAIAIPPMGSGLSSLLLKKKFTEEERGAGVSSIILGCVGITEGAISYAAADPLHMIPINMISSAVAATISYLVGAGCAASWGGLIVLPVCTNRIGYVLAIAAGVAVHVVLCKLLKKDVSETEQPSESDDDDVEIDLEF